MWRDLLQIGAGLTGYQNPGLGLALLALAAMGGVTSLIVGTFKLIKFLNTKAADSNSFIGRLALLMRRQLIPIMLGAMAVAGVILVGGAIAGAIAFNAAPSQGAANTRPDTRLRIRLDPAGGRNYVQDGQSNITYWQQTIFEMSAQDANKTPIIHVDTISLTFDQDIDFERPTIESFGHKIGGYNYYPLGRKGAVFQFYDAISAPMIEIWFPPLGYYAEQSKKNAIGSK